METKNKAQYLHLRLPVDTLESLVPTGCRKSKEAEAAWRLSRALEVARQFKERGTLPILKREILPEKRCNKEMNIPLCEEDIKFLTQTSMTEGGSRGRLARELLMTAKAAIDAYTVSLTSEALVAEIKKLFP